MTDFQRSIGDRYDDTDELYNITAQNIYEMPELYGEDNPHPIMKLATKAGQFKTPTYSYKPIEAVSIQANPGLFSDFTQLTESAKPGLLEQSLNSVNAGMLADGQLYDYAGNQPPYEKTTDDYHEARTKAADTILPKAGMSATQKAISSVAATNNNRGFEYLESMQWGLKNSRADVIQGRNEAEKNFTYKTGAAVGKALGKPIKEQWPETTKSAHNSESSYQLLFSDDPKAYRQGMQKKIETGANAIKNNDFTAVDLEGMKKDSKNLYAGLETKWLKTRNLGAKGIIMMQDAVLQRDKQLIDAKWLAQNVVDTRNRIAQNEAGLIKPWDLKLDPNDPIASIDNLRTYCYQSVLGQHIFDIALIYGTRGKGKTLSFAANVLDAAGDHYADDVLKNGVTSPWQSINRGFQVAGDVSEQQEMLNSLADRLDPVSSVALKFLIAQFSENELQELITETRKRKEYIKQRQAKQAKNQRQ